MLDHRRFQKIFLSAMGLFVLFLALMIAYRSSARRGLLLGDEADGVRGALREIVKTDSALHIQEFSRTQTKDGKTVWTVKARDASYYPQSDLAHVNDAEITLYRKDAAPCVIHSSAGKLYLHGEQLQRADFEGEVKFSVSDDSLHLETTFASYDAATNLLEIPGAVKISGPGYVLNAVGMRMAVDNQVVDLLSQVQSEFEPASSKGAPQLVHADPPAAIKATAPRNSGNNALPKNAKIAKPNLVPTAKQKQKQVIKKKH